MGNQNCRIIGNLKFDKPLREEHAKYHLQYNKIALRMALPLQSFLFCADHDRIKEIRNTRAHPNGFGDRKFAWIYPILLYH